MARTPFKLKSSPTKGKLSDFFKGLGRKGTEARLTKQVQENQGMTNFEKRQADKAAERKSGGKSKFQRAGAKTKANKAATAAGNARNAADKKAREEQTTKSNIEITKTPTVEVDGNKVDGNKKKPYVKPGGKATGSMKDYAVGSKERYNEYEARGWKHDATTKGGRPGSSQKNPKNIVKVKGAVEGDYYNDAVNKKQYQFKGGKYVESPVEKKSPAKNE